MILLSAAESRELDRLTQSSGVPSYRLMTRAGEEVAAAVTRHWADRLAHGVVVVCGKGNNGGDGLVAARKLHQEGVALRVLLTGRRDEFKGDAARARADYEAVGGTLIEDAGAEHLPTDDGVIIDAIFGTGLNAIVGGRTADLIERMNGAGAPIVAVDIASGVNADTGAVMGRAVRAALTVTFGYAKYGHVSYPGAEYCGSLEVVDIGFAPSAMAQIAPAGRLVEAAEARAWIPWRRENTHKGTYGHLLIIGGSRGKSGAVLLAARGALHSGAGLVTAAIPESILASVAAGQAELMTAPLPERAGGLAAPDAIARLRELLNGKDATALGPGLGVTPDTIAVVAWLVEEGANPQRPLLIDADGLNAVAELGAERLKTAPGPVVLTPHPGEMARLLKSSIAEVNADRIGAARRLAELSGAAVLLKGARSVVAAANRVSINGSGNPGMATPGMGDVLSGIVGALMGQGIEPATALRLGVFVHGYAADRIAQRGAAFGYLASEVAAELPAAFGALAEGGPGRRGESLEGRASEDLRTGGNQSG